MDEEVRSAPSTRDVASADRLFLSLLRASASSAVELRRRLGATGELEVARGEPQRAG